MESWNEMVIPEFNANYSPSILGALAQTLHQQIFK